MPCFALFFTNSVRRSVACIFLLSALSDCGVGVGVFHQKHIDFDSTRELKNRVRVLDKKIGYIGESVDLEEAKKRNIPMVLTKDYVLKIWGEPNKKEQKDGYEYWYYKREYSVSGLVFGVLIIDIPILLPSGNHYTIMVFDNNQLEKIVYQVGGLSGIFLQSCHRDGCLFVDNIGMGWRIY